jgi:hypothetical protein
VHLDYFNTQGQVKFTWAKTFSLARAYLDQLERSKPGDAGKIAEFRKALDRAEKAPEAEQRNALNQLATRLESEASGAGDPAKVRTLAGTVRQLATEPRLARGR